MPTDNKIKFGIILFAVLLVCVSFLTGESIDDNLFRWLSGATGTVTIIVLVYEKWIWKFPIIAVSSQLNGVPVIHGTWKGKLKYIQDYNKKPGEIDIYFSIDQTLTTVSVRAFTSSSPSYTQFAKIEKFPNKTTKLIYFYTTEPTYEKKNTNRPTDGAGIIEIIGFPPNKLLGSYFTDRGGMGIIEFKKHNSKTTSTYTEAEMLFK